MILEKEMRAVSDELFVTTDDGSCGAKGLVTDKLRELIAAGRRSTSSWPSAPSR